MEIISRSITYQQYVRMAFQGLKADGSPGAFDASDHPIVWTVDGVDLAGGMKTIGIGRFNCAGDGGTADCHALSPSGGMQTFDIVATADADLSLGEVRNIVWQFQLALTVVPDEAVVGSGSVSQPIDL